MAMVPQFSSEYIKMFYSSEGHRLLSFRHWPGNSLIKPFSLAYFGFFCLTPTVTQCFACLQCIGNWNVGDDPFKRHTEMSPDCPFLKNPGDLNVVLDLRQRQNIIDKVDTYRRKMEVFYKLEENRRLSFSNAKIYDPKKVHVWYGLAADGFFGINSHTVECFACNERLSLRERSKVVQTHDKMFKTCPFLLGLSTNNQRMTFQETEQCFRYYEQKGQAPEDHEIPNYEENLTVITERDPIENPRSSLLG